MSSLYGLKLPSTCAIGWDVSRAYAETTKRRGQFTFFFIFFTYGEH